MSEKIIITEEEAMLIDVKPPTPEEIEANKKRPPWTQHDYSKWEKQDDK